MRRQKIEFRDLWRGLFRPHFSHARHKTIASFGNRLDVMFQVLGCQNLPQTGNVFSQVDLFNERIGPNLLHHFVLIDHVPVVFYQNQ